MHGLVSALEKHHALYPLDLERKAELKPQVP